MSNSYHSKKIDRSEGNQLEQFLYGRFESDRQKPWGMERQITASMTRACHEYHHPVVFISIAQETKEWRFIGSIFPR
jgi:hypothetical protein